MFNTSDSIESFIQESIDKGIKLWLDDPIIVMLYMVLCIVYFLASITMVKWSIKLTNDIIVFYLCSAFCITGVISFILIISLFIYHTI